MEREFTHRLRGWKGLTDVFPKQHCYTGFYYARCAFTGRNGFGMSSEQSPLSIAKLRSQDTQTTAGPLEWTFRLAPRKYAYFLSWLTGWANLFSWLCGSAANVAVMAFQIVFLANLFNPTYESKSWHIFLIMEGILLFNMLLNVFGTRLLPKIDHAQFWWFLGSFFIVAIVAVACAHPHQPAKFVFATFINETGWTNPFVVFMNGNFVILDLS